MNRKSSLRNARLTAPLFELHGEPSTTASVRAHARASAADRIFVGPPAARPWTAGVRAGIDEAGLGPLLGPLAIGYSAFRVPPQVASMWEALRSTCTDNVDDDRERLVVADSKIVFTRDARSARRLERTALAFLALRDRERRRPPDARSLLDGMARDVCAASEGSEQATCAPSSEDSSEPWRRHLARALPVHGEQGALDALVARLDQALSGAGIELAGAGVRIVPVRELNASFAETLNKSLTHWRATQTLLARSWHTHAHEGLDLVVDRHGGRMYYAELLAEMFAPCSIHILAETPPCSEYIVVEPADASDAPERADGRDAPERADVRDAPARADGRDAPARVGGRDAPVRRRMRITFAERAESTSFAVALASCLAKYARETCMNAFNAYFESLQPGLKPTAGYRNDGWRWLEEAGSAIARSGLARCDLVRER